MNEDYKKSADECRCGKHGEPRTDNGLPCGVHCDECFEKMVSECRSSSW